MRLHTMLLEIMAEVFGTVKLTFSLTLPVAFLAITCSADTSNVATPYVVFLGTGAADISTPEKCGCDNCRYIREHGGKNKRLFSSFYAHPGLLIDFSTTGMESLKNAGIEPKQIDYLLFTHSHGDHCDPASVVTLVENRQASVKGNLQVFCNFTTAKRLKDYLTALGRKVPIVITELKPYQVFQAGQWSCMSLAANHAADEDCLLYLLQCGDHVIFYATDTTWFPVRTFQEVAARKLDIAVVEATFGPRTGAEYLIGHMNFEFARKVKEYLAKTCLKSNGVFALTHLSLDSCPPYDLLHDKMAAEGILVPYDGLRLPITKP